MHILDVGPELGKRFSAMSLICAIMVVFLHMGATDCMDSSGWWFYVVVKQICKMVVPWFFFASGFFIVGYYGESGWYVKSLKSRGKSLRIPYVVWMFFVSTLGYAVTTVSFASRLPGFSLGNWTTSILGKGLVLVAICLVSAYGIRVLFPSSFLRIVGLVIVNAGLCAVVSYGFVLTKTERSYLVSNARVLIYKYFFNRRCSDAV
jgi:fucose 4-O-acetylase-like acetyltransferase